MLSTYRENAAQRLAQGIPALPLNATQTQALTELLQNPPAGEEDELLHLLSERIPPGVDEAAYVKATWLSAVAQGEAKSPLVSALDATRLLGTMVGGYNVENALAAAAAAIAVGVTPALAAERLARAPQVAGRLETVVREPFHVLIDFAHTPAALSGALGALRPLTDGRLIVLFGAGGDRDRTKRKPMAEAVARVADVAVLTSDNPRTEDPDAIIDDLAEGVGEMEFVRMTDRRAAIRAALEVARPGDTVVLAGKGHERYQVIGTEKQPFDEAAIARDALRELGVL